MKTASVLRAMPESGRHRLYRGTGTTFPANLNMTTADAEALI
jgi:hypothetical protein